MLRRLLGCALLFSMNLAAADVPQPAANLPAFTNVTAAEVDAFVTKWNAAFNAQTNREWGFMLAMDQMLKAETNPVQLVARLLGALEHKPAGLWVSCLKMLPQPVESGTLPPVQMEGVWKQACTSLEQAAHATPKDPLIRQALELARESCVAACLEAGRNLDDAQAAARPHGSHCTAAPMKLQLEGGLGRQRR